MSNVSKRKKEGARTKIKTMGDHQEFLRRISKTLYYGQLPTLPCLSLPVTEISCAVWSVAQRGRSLRRLRADAAAGVARAACVSPCALVLAILYMERLKRCNAAYLAAAEPSDLFLVSLMVSNKFLQDDGEDDEVMCSEWAASGGVELRHLKKLEIEFLNAIDWNVFVSEESFEEGLEWLERQVALKQAQLHGFFTYTDLAATCEGAALRELLHACLAAALACAGALLAVLTSAFLLTNAAHSAHSAARAPARPASDLAPELAADYEALRPRRSNDTADALAELLADEINSNELRCCERWSRHLEESDPKRNWYDGVVEYDWRAFEPWWSRTSVLNWLYQSSLIGPLQRWLERAGRLLRRELTASGAGGAGGEPLQRCDAHVHFGERQRCIRQWLNLSKLSVLVASVSDR